MKVCYHKLHKGMFEYRVSGTSSSNLVHAWFWKYLWKLKIPPKVKMYVWKVVCKFLPTKENLFKMRIVTIQFVCKEFNHWNIYYYNVYGV